LENAHRISAVAFDKTGTITNGKLKVTAVRAFNGFSQRALVSLAASVESHSEHPLARAIVRYAEQNEIEINTPRNFRAIPGRGAEAEIDGQRVILGKLTLLEDMGIIGDGIDKALLGVKNGSQTTVMVGASGKIVGMLAISDEIRLEPARAVEELRREGIRHIVLITGDNNDSATAVGRAIGADEIYAELLPWEKADKVRMLQAKYGHVAMVGDGVNDAPALASGDIGIAMGAAGSDSALETADVALMSDDLLKIPWLIRLSRKTRGIIIQNIGLAITVKFVFVTLATLGMATLWMAVFADMGISLLVIFNGLRALQSQ